MGEVSCTSTFHRELIGTASVILHIWLFLECMTIYT